ncbi:MAG: patatin [Gammaproteobacteria bacterium SG8_11]|nr:MAG: patatin [Gammaproteobacteria bacterium SG8_11]
MTKKKRPVIGLALGSGAARGWAHIGVLKELRARGIEPAVITGTSIGAFVGAAYVAGYLEQLQQWVCDLTRRDIIRYMDVQLFAGGFITGNSQKKMIREKLGDVKIESLKIPYAAVATNLKTGREVWFQQGSLLDAVHASVALPGLFSPVHVEGHWLVDGGLVNPVPVSVCRALGAEVVIAVNLNSDIVGRHLKEQDFEEEEEKEADENLSIMGFLDQVKKNLFKDEESFVSRLWTKQQEKPGVFDVLVGSINIMQDRITRSRLAGDPPELMLAPRLSHLGLMEFDRADEAIEEGRACVNRMVSALDYVIQR